MKTGLLITAHLDHVACCVTPEKLILDICRISTVSQATLTAVHRISTGTQCTLVILIVGMPVRWGGCTV